MSYTKKVHEISPIRIGSMKGLKCLDDDKEINVPPSFNQAFLIAKRDERLYFWVEHGAEAQFFEKQIASHFEFQSTDDEKVCDIPFHVRFDEPVSWKQSNYEYDFSWTALVFSTEEVVFTPNMKQKEAEKEEIEKWEKSNPGRRLLAAANRKKNLVLNLYQNSLVLDNQEKRELNDVVVGKLIKLKKLNGVSKSMGFNMCVGPNSNCNIKEDRLYKELVSLKTDCNAARAYEFTNYSDLISNNSLANSTAFDRTTSKPFGNFQVNYNKEFSFYSTESVRIKMQFKHSRMNSENLSSGLGRSPPINTESNVKLNPILSMANFKEKAHPDDLTSLKQISLPMVLSTEESIISSVQALKREEVSSRKAAQLAFGELQKTRTTMSKKQIQYYKPAIHFK